jgi:hypothetical protein
VAHSRFSRDMKAVRKVHIETARAARELDKAGNATHEAIDALKVGSRDLMERIEEARAHIGVSSEDDKAAPISVDPFRLRLPMAASLAAVSPAKLGIAELIGRS